MTSSWCQKHHYPSLPLQSLDKRPPNCFWKKLIWITRIVQYLSGFCASLNHITILRQNTNPIGKMRISVKSWFLLQNYMGHFQCKLLTCLKMASQKVPELLYAEHKHQLLSFLKYLYKTQVVEKLLQAAGSYFCSRRWALAHGARPRAGCAQGAGHGRLCAAAQHCTNKLSHGPALLCCTAVHNNNARGAQDKPTPRDIPSHQHQPILCRRQKKTEHCYFV